MSTDDIEQPIEGVLQMLCRCPHSGSPDVVCKLLCCSNRIATRIHAAGTNSLVIFYTANSIQQLQWLRGWLQKQQHRDLVKSVNLQLQRLVLCPRISLMLLDVIRLLARVDGSSKLWSLSIDQPVSDFKSASGAAIKHIAAALLPAVKAAGPCGVAGNPSSSAASSTIATASPPENTPHHGIISMRWMGSYNLPGSNKQVDDLCSILQDQNFMCVVRKVHLKVPVLSNYVARRLYFVCNTFGSKLGSLELLLQRFSMPEIEDPLVESLEKIATAATAFAESEIGYSVIVKYDGPARFQRVVAAIGTMPYPIVVQSAEFNLASDRDGFQPQVFVKQLLPLFTKLKDLRLRVDSGNISPAALEHFSALSGLTGLESFSLSGSQANWSPVAVLQAMTNLRNLRNLKLELDFGRLSNLESDYNEQGMAGLVISPALTQLTGLNKLSIGAYEWPEDPMYVMRDSTIPSSVKWLELDGVEDLSVVTGLSQLETLVFRGTFLSSPVAGSDYQCLTCLSNLKDMRVNIRDIDDVSQLSRLGCVWGALPIKQLDLLAQAEVMARPFMERLGQLHRLEKLSVEIDASSVLTASMTPIYVQLGALGAALRHSPNLHTVELYCEQGAQHVKYVGASELLDALVELPNLRTLNLHIPEMGDLARKLTVATQLTYLALHGCDVPDLVVVQLWLSLPNIQGVGSRFVS